MTPKATGILSGGFDCRERVKYLGLADSNQIADSSEMGPRCRFGESVGRCARSTVAAHVGPRVFPVS